MFKLSFWWLFKQTLNYYQWSAHCRPFCCWKGTGSCLHTDQVNTRTVRVLSGGWELITLVCKIKWWANTQGCGHLREDKPWETYCKHTQLITPSGVTDFKMQDCSQTAQRHKHFTKTDVKLSNERQTNGLLRVLLSHTQLNLNTNRFN